MNKNLRDDFAKRFASALVQIPIKETLWGKVKRLFGYREVEYINPEEVADMAYEYADAMMKERDIQS